MTVVLYGLMVALQHLLRTLESKGVLSKSETVAMLDGVLDELRATDFQPGAAAEAHKTVGALYLPKRSGLPG